MIIKILLFTRLPFLKKSISSPRARASSYSFNTFLQSRPLMIVLVPVETLGSKSSESFTARSLTSEVFAQLAGETGVFNHLMSSGVFLHNGVTRNRTVSSGTEQSTFWKDPER